MMNLGWGFSSIVFLAPRAARKVLCCFPESAPLFAPDPWPTVTDFNHRTQRRRRNWGCEEWRLPLWLPKSI